jgi:hypothetical protein
VRGSRRSIATRPLGIAPDASRSRRLRYEKAAGPFPIPSASKDPLESPTPRHGRAPLAGALTLWKSCSSLNLPAGGAPTWSPGSLQGQAQAHLSANELPTGLPPGPTAACPIRRPAQGRERIDRKAGLYERRLAFHPVCASTRGKPARDAISIERLAPPAGGNRPRIPYIFRCSSLAQGPWTNRSPPKGPDNPAIRRFRVSR